MHWKYCTSHYPVSMKGRISVLSPNVAVNGCRISPLISGKIRFRPDSNKKRIWYIPSSDFSASTNCCHPCLLLSNGPCCAMYNVCCTRHLVQMTCRTGYCSTSALSSPVQCALSLTHQSEKVLCLVVGKKPTWFQSQLIHLKWSKRICDQSHWRRH